MGVLPPYVWGKHAVGLGESSAALKGFQVVPGSYRKGYQDRDNRHIKIGERWLQDYKVSQWAQSDFSGGQYQDILVDDAMFARCCGMIVGNYGDRKGLRTTQSLKLATEKTSGNPINPTNYSGLGSITDYMWAWDKLFVLSQTAGTIYVFSPDQSAGGEGKFTVATIYVGTTATCMTANRTIGSIVVGHNNGKVTEFKRTDYTLWRAFRWDLGEAIAVHNRMPQRLRDVGVSKLHMYNGYVIVAMGNRIFYYDGANANVGATASDHCDTCEWIDIGDASESWVRGFCEFQNLLLVMSQTGYSQCAIDATNLSGSLMPWVRVPYMFLGQSLITYAGRLYVGGAGYDFEGQVSYGQLFEVDGSSFRELRCWYDMYSQFGGSTYVPQVASLTVHEGMLFMPDEYNRGLVAYDFIGDAFFGCYSLDATKTSAAPKRVISAGSYLLVLAYGVDGGLYYVPKANFHNVTSWVETSEFALEPALGKRWLTCQVHSRYGGTGLEVSTDGGYSWTSVTRTQLVRSGYNFVSFFDLSSLAMSGSIRLRVAFDQTDVFSSSSYYWRELVEIVVGFMVEPPKLRQWNLAFTCAENLEYLDGSGVDSYTDPDDVVAQLHSWYKNGTILSFQDRDGTQALVMITLCQENEPALVATTAGNRETYVTVTLAETTST